MPMPRTINPATQFEIFDDFFFLNTALWTSVDDGGTGTNTANAVRGGEASLVTAGADNDYHYYKGAAANCGTANQKPLWFEARFSLTEANTDDANFAFGLSSVVDATVVGNDGAGPPSSYSGILFFKVDGGTVFQFETSNGSTQNTNTSLCAFVSGKTYRVGFHLDTRDGTTAYAYPWVYNETDGTLLTTGTTSQALALPLSLTSIAAMSPIFGVKAGGANVETLKVDYVRWVGTR